MREYDQEMPQSQTTGQYMASQGRDTEHRQPQHKVKQPFLIAKLLRKGTKAEGLDGGIMISE